MTIADIDLIECNEAFAAVVLKFMREMGIDSPERVNVNGQGDCAGASAEATGAILLATALDELERCQQSTALIHLCAGVAWALRPLSSECRHDRNDARAAAH